MSYNIGDSIILSNGMVGKVTSISDEKQTMYTTYEILLTDGRTITVARNAINRKEDTHRRGNFSAFFLDNVKREFVELIADFLDSDIMIYLEGVEGVEDPINREETDLHIRMAEAMFEVYINTVKAKTISSEHRNTKQ